MFVIIIGVKKDIVNQGKREVVTGVNVREDIRENSVILVSILYFCHMLLYKKTSLFENSQIIRFKLNRLNSLNLNNIIWIPLRNTVEL